MIKDIEDCIRQTALKHDIDFRQAKTIVYEAYPQLRPSFAKLPDEIVMHVILQLNPYELGFFCSASLRMRAICRDKQLWKNMWEKYLPEKKNRDFRLEETFYKIHEARGLELKKRFQKGPLDYKALFKKFLSIKHARLALIHYLDGHFHFTDEEDISFSILNHIYPIAQNIKTRKVKIPGLSKHIEYRATIDLDAFFKFLPEKNYLTVPLGVWAISCDACGIEGIDLPRGLVFFSGSHNSLRKLDLPDSLVVLKCSENKLEGLIDLKNAFYVKVDRNKIEAIKFNPTRLEAKEGVERITLKTGTKVGLRYLNISQNKLTELDLTKSNLTYLNASNNKLHKVILPKNSELQTVDVNNNKLEKMMVPQTVRNFSYKGNPWKYD